MHDTSECDPLRASFRDLLATECGHQAVVDHAAGRRDLASGLWQMVADLGWSALGIPEAHGGLGLGLDALAALYEELGRAAAPLPCLATNLAADAIARSGDDAQRAAWLPRIAAGAPAAACAPAALVAPALRVVREGRGWHLSGTTMLLDAAGAALLVLLARDGDGTMWRIVVEPTRDEIAVTPCAAWDRTRTPATMAFDRWPVPEGRMMASPPPIEEALAVHAALALAADAVGGADAMLALTVDYLKTRQQFGRPLGSFQALKHRVADHRTRIVAGHALVDAAVGMAVAGDAGAATEASAAKALACGDFADIARDCIQLHGGIGFTAEHPSHLYLNRARLSLVLFGGRDVHLARATAGLLAA